MKKKMRINIFRNPFIDVQVGYLIDNLVDARRKETEAYWRETITKEILEHIDWIPKEDGGYCYVVHYCDVIETIGLSNGKA